jgi:hypothetical protein
LHTNSGFLSSSTQQASLPEPPLLRFVRLVQCAPTKPWQRFGNATNMFLFRNVSWKRSSSHKRGLSVEFSSTLSAFFFLEPRFAPSFTPPNLCQFDIPTASKLKLHQSTRLSLKTISYPTQCRDILAPFYPRCHQTRDRKDFSVPCIQVSFSPK